MLKIMSLEPLSVGRALIDVVPFVFHMNGGDVVGPLLGEILESMQPAPALQMGHHVLRYGT
jgi:hypothetical protein